MPPTTGATTSRLAFLSAVLAVLALAAVRPSTGTPAGVAAGGDRELTSARFRLDDASRYPATVPDRTSRGAASKLTRLRARTFDPTTWQGQRTRPRPPLRVTWGDGGNASNSTSGIPTYGEIFAAGGTGRARGWTVPCPPPTRPR